MAESAATQSPSVSSSSSLSSGPEAASAGSPGGCPALGPKSCGSSCADSFVSSSSSQPVSLFSTSQGLSSLCSDELPSEIMASAHFSSEIHKTDHTAVLGAKSKMLGSQPPLAKEGKDCVALLDVQRMENPQETSKDIVDSSVSIVAEVPCHHPSNPPNPPDFAALEKRKEAGQMEQHINKDQESKNPNEVLSRGDTTPLVADDRFTLLPVQKPPTELSKATGICSYSLSPSEVTGSSVFEKDSPESPFEVIIDKATFDKEFKDSYKESANDFGSWAVHTDGESSADILESNDKVFPLRSKEVGRYPASALRSRQFSHTNAALEEVSRCVNDMHNFTNEILTWDLVPQVKQQNDKSDHTTKAAGLDMSGYDSEIPVINLKANTHQKIPVCSINGSTSPTASPGDWGKAPVTKENTIIKKSMADTPRCTKEVSTSTPGIISKQDDILSESSDASLEKYTSLDSGVSAAKVVLPGDHMKGEMPWQDPGVGEVAEADSSGESDDTVIEDITIDTAFENNKIETEKSPVPCAVLKTDEKEVKESLTYNKESKTSKISGFVSSSGKIACSQASDKNVQPEDVEQPVKTENPKLPSAASPSGFDETESPLHVKSSAYLELLHDDSIKDIDDSSPEDLIAAFTEDREKVIVDQSEAIATKTTNIKTSEHEARDSEIKDLKCEGFEQSKEKKASTFQGVYPDQDIPVASLDLEQEQLTIQALKELSERQVEKSASAQHTIGSPEEPFKPTDTFAPESSSSQRSCDALEHTGVRTGSDPGVSKNPTVVKETTRVDTISGLSKTDLVKEHILGRLLTDISVHDLIFWRDVKKTGFVFGTTLIVLLSLAAFSVISVVSYLILALLSVTISFRVYKSVIQAVQKSEEGHPFKAYLDVDITLSSEAFHNYMNAAMVHINKALKLVIRLFLVEDLVDSLKLAVFMWLMTYVGAVFNGITLLILADLLVFSVPIVYEKYKTQIDHYVGIIRDQTKSIVEKIQAKLPGIAKKKAE
ncbi:reticulon-3 isoform X2 [Suncus etruscus]|uniref:reticulon-3 isoform X2 n=1 Tax=Suncus etruscus TaxID=109475 RepID=UPI002110B780|nr:reticulon-3 isoform X2 [Suncus etruscus]